MKISIFTFMAFVALMAATSCRQVYELLEETSPRIPQTKEFASDLKAPLGMAMDAQGRLWVTEAGTGKDDSQLSVLMPDGKKYVAITGFPSEFRASENISVGLNHLLLEGHTVWLLHDKGLLFKVDLSRYVPGTTPINAASLKSEDIGTFVKNYTFERDTEMSNPYNLCLGPEGDIYIADAGANAIIRRSKQGMLSLFAVIPGVSNPAPVGPPVTEGVPTSIVYNGQQFFVTTLLGFPFPAGKARIYELDRQGKVSLYQEGFNSLTDLTFTPDNKPVVIEHGRFDRGFVPNSGRLIRTDGKEITVLLEKLNRPTAVISSGRGTYYVNSFTEGKILKVQYAY